jgi:hypothetical protein
MEGQTADPVLRDHLLRGFEDNFKRIDRQQGAQQRMLNQILLNTACLPGIDKRLDMAEKDVKELQAAHNRTRGASGLVAVLLASWEAVRWFLKF